MDIRLFLLAYLLLLPLVLVWAVGAVIVLKKHYRYPNVARSLLIALTIMLVAHHASLALSLFLPGHLSQQDMPAVQIAWVLRLQQEVLIILTAVTWALSIRAAFAGRNSAGA